MYNNEELEIVILTRQLIILLGIILCIYPLYKNIYIAETIHTYFINTENCTDCYTSKSFTGIVGISKKLSDKNYWVILGDSFFVLGLLLNRTTVTLLSRLGS